MSRYNDLQPIIDGVFRQRGDEVVAGETVSEIGNKKKASKPRLIILTRPLGGSAGATLTIVAIEPNHQRVKLKSVFAVDRLTEVSSEGSFDATFNFGASGLLSVSFESHIQREMFVAAARRLQTTLSSAGARGGYADGRLGTIRGVLTEAMGAEAEADAAARVRKLRQDKRRVFTTEEEQHLLKHMGSDGAGFDDIKQFQEALLRQQKSSELKSLDLLTASESAWQEAQRQVQDLVQDVEEVEQRIEKYSTHLLSKKSVIQQVEHDNNTLQRRQQNLEGLYIMMADLRDQLSLEPATVALLGRLRTLPEEDLVVFFSEGSNAVTLSVAMKHMQAVLHNPKLDSDFPIKAVAERKAYFLSQRKMITQRSKAYILSTIESFEAIYFADKARYSRDSSLVWRLHVELSVKLMNISDIICALGRIDVEGFGSALRKYRSSMQKIYALEIARFFKTMKKQIKKLNSWRGPFLLGTSETRGEAVSIRTETAQAGEAHRMFLCASAATPALTPRMMQYGDDNGTDAGGGRGRSAGNRGDDDHTRLTVQFPSVADLHMVGNVSSSAIELYESASTLRKLDVRAETSSVVSGIKSLAPTTSGGGYLRPDMAFAIALESAVLAVLHEESILRACFGLVNATAEHAADDARVNTSNAWSSALGADARDGATVASTTGGTGGPFGDAETDADRVQMMQDSLLELFGGADANTLVRVLQGNSRATSGRPSRSNSQGRDIGLPPRPPPAASSGAESGFPHQRTWSGASSMGFGGHGSSLSGGDDHDSDFVDDGTLRGALHRNFLVRSMRDLANYFVEKCDRIYCIPVLCMIRAYRRRTESTMLPSKSAFCQFMLAELESIMSGGMVQFVAEQTESITRCRRRYVVKPTALLHCFAKLPALFLRFEVVHNELAANVVDRTEYSSIALSLVDQSFDALDQITNVKSTVEDMNEQQLKLHKLIAQKVNAVLDGVEADVNSLKWVFIQQYRHQSFFCAFYSTLACNSFAVQLLQDHYASSKVKRDRYEELYLTRIILVGSFPIFGVFAISAEDLSMIYSKEELRHHKALAVDAVGKVVAGLEKELRSGVKASAARMKKHFLRDVDLNGNEASFHRTLLQRTWQHFSTLLLQKFDFLSDLLMWSVYRDLSMTVTRTELADLLASY